MLVLRSGFALVRRSCRCIPVTLNFSTDTKPTDYNEIKHPTKVPLKPVVQSSQCSSDKFTIDQSTLELLERLSLCNLSDKEALDTLEESIEFASKILHLNTDEIEPMYFPNESEPLVLREDIEKEGNIRKELLKNAPITDDTCFVAPPGNIPVELEEKDFQIAKKK